MSVEPIDSLLVATGNAGKAAEFEEMLGGRRSTADGSRQERQTRADSFAVSRKPLTVDLLPAGVESPEETGATFCANACLKATYYARHFRRWTLADDSGLAVDALNGSPGVLSARWAERHDAGRGDSANNALLLRQLEGIQPAERSARFVCVLALADAAGRIVLTARGEMLGQILNAPRGANGFGYDPLFLAGQSAKTTAELSPAEKHAISHRGHALRRLRALMVREGLL